MTVEKDAPGTAMELVAQGAQLIRITNETMVQAAILRPRDEAAIVKAALAELDLMPEWAAKAYYTIPYRDGDQVVNVTGPSIKAAQTLVRRWGNCAWEGIVMSSDEDGWDVAGVFLDYETMYRIARPFRVSKWLKRRGGQTVRLDVRQQVQALQAGISKGMRNVAINGGLPVYLVAAYDAKARAIVGGKLDAPADPKAVAGAVAAFSKLGLKDAMAALEKHVGRPAKEWTGSDVADLRGLYNSVEDEHITLAEAFGLAPEAPQEPMSKAEGEAAQKISSQPGEAVGSPRSDVQVVLDIPSAKQETGQGGPAAGQGEAEIRPSEPPAQTPPATPATATSQATQAAPAKSSIPAQESPFQYWLRMITETKSLQEFEAWWTKFARKGGRLGEFVADEQKRLTAAKEKRKAELSAKKG